MSVSYLCYQCHGVIEDLPHICPHCRASLEPPDCPRCQRPVRPDRPPQSHLQKLSWNAFWNMNCEHCGYKHESKSVLPIGHDPRPLALTPGGWKRGETTISIRGTHSNSVWMDSWEYLPVVSIDIERTQDGYFPDGTPGLPKHSSIELTVSELLEIIRVSQSELKPLLQQQPWWYDTT